GVIGKVDALPGIAVVELQILVDVVAQLGIRRDRCLVRGLGNAAEFVVVHQRAAERNVPRRHGAVAGAATGGAFSGKVRSAANAAGADNPNATAATQATFFMTSPRSLARCVL